MMKTLCQRLAKSDLCMMTRKGFLMGQIQSYLFLAPMLLSVDQQSSTLFCSNPTDNTGYDAWQVSQSSMICTYVWRVLLQQTYQDVRSHFAMLLRVMVSEHIQLNRPM